ncbi:hypothetical protein DFJ74DRAFT_708313 [Hyaloraphidium curvatum]|nr:hypothetical protein DFJ74DRAFT_708313 [Hyaloraphidium curvatum]
MATQAAEHDAPPASLQTLPPELLDQIFSYDGPSMADLHRCRRACRTVGVAAKAAFLGRVRTALLGPDLDPHLFLAFIDDTRGHHDDASGPPDCANDEDWARFFPLRPEAIGGILRAAGIGPEHGIVRLFVEHNARRGFSRVHSAATLLRGMRATTAHFAFAAAVLDIAGTADESNNWGTLTKFISLARTGVADQVDLTLRLRHLKPGRRWLAVAFLEGWVVNSDPVAADVFVLDNFPRMVQLSTKETGRTSMLFFQHLATSLMHVPDPFISRALETSQELDWISKAFLFACIASDQPAQRYFPLLGPFLSRPRCPAAVDPGASTEFFSTLLGYQDTMWWSDFYARCAVEDAWPSDMDPLSPAIGFHEILAEDREWAEAFVGTVVRDERPELPELGARLRRFADANGLRGSAAWLRAAEEGFKWGSHERASQILGAFVG